MQASEMTNEQLTALRIDMKTADESWTHTQGRLVSVMTSQDFKVLTGESRIKVVDELKQRDNEAARRYCEARKAYIDACSEVTGRKT